METTSCANFFFIFIIFNLLLSLSCVYSKKDNSKDAVDEKWKKKHITDYNDADLERLYEQWEEDDDPLEEDELPEWKRPDQKIDLTQLDPNDPQSMLKMTKKGKTLMMFATVSGNPEERETETISQIWQTSLFNANVEVQRYVVGSNRVLFVLKDGSKAWEIKDYLTTQDNCEVVTIEGQDYYGKGSKKYKKVNQDENKTNKKKKNKKEKKIEL